MGRVCSLLAFPQVVVCGGSRVVKASLESAKWASNVHVHVKVSHRSLAIIPFRSREAICYSTAFQNSRLFRTLNSCVTFSRYTRYLVPGRHLAGLYVTPNLGQKLQVTHAKHAFSFVTSATARNHRRTSTRGDTRALSPSGDKRVLSPPGVLPLLPQGMLFPPQWITVCCPPPGPVPLV